MKIHFAKLRRYIAWSSFVGPLLFFAAFLLAIRGWTLWACILVVFAIFILGAFPCESKVDNQSEKTEHSILAGINIAGTFLFLFWLDTIPEWKPFIDRLFSNGAAQDWRLTSAVFIWFCIWGYTRHKKASALRNHEIVSIYDAIPEDQIK
jgi:hypothetical protein